MGHQFLHLDFRLDFRVLLRHLCPLVCLPVCPLVILHSFPVRHRRRFLFHLQLPVLLITRVNLDPETHLLLDHVTIMSHVTLFDIIESHHLNHVTREMFHELHHVTIQLKLNEK